MKVKEYHFNNNRVLIFDAPIETTHSKITFYDGVNYLIYKKNKLLDLYAFDESKSDSELINFYENKLVNIGSIKFVTDGLVGDLFNVVKNGNFHDYEYNGIYYPTAVDIINEIINQECKFINPYILLIKK